jgi:hypothetical protein
MKQLLEYLDKQIDYFKKEDEGTPFTVFNELMKIRLYLNQYQKETFELIEFDYDDEPKKEYLKLTFRADRENVKEILKKRRYMLGGGYAILGAASNE